MTKNKDGVEMIGDWEIPALVYWAGAVIASIGALVLWGVGGFLLASGVGSWAKNMR